MLKHRFSNDYNIIILLLWRVAAMFIAVIEGGLIFVKALGILSS